MGSGTVTSAENRAVIDSSTGVIERTNAAPSRTADSGTMASPMGPIVVDSGTPPSLEGLPEPQVRKNLFAAGPISPIVDQLDAENRRVLALMPDPHGHRGPAREDVALIQQALSGTRQNPTMVEWSPTPMSGSRRFPSLVEESPALGAYPKRTRLLLGVAKYKESANQRLSSICRHASIKTRLLLGDAKNKESKT